MIKATKTKSVCRTEKMDSSESVALSAVDKYDSVFVEVWQELEVFLVFVFLQLEVSLSTASSIEDVSSNSGFSSSRGAMVNGV